MAVGGLGLRELMLLPGVEGGRGVEAGAAGADAAAGAAVEVVPEAVAASRA